MGKLWRKAFSILRPGSRLLRSRENERNVAACTVAITPSPRRYTTQASEPEAADGSVSLKKAYQETILPWQREADFLNYMRDRIIYQDKDMIAFDKPSGVPMHAYKYTGEYVHGAEAPIEADISMKGLTQAMVRGLETVIHREVFSLDRLHSGVVVYAKTEKTEEVCRKYFRHTRAQRVLHQKYTVLVNGEMPAEGEEKFPVEIWEIDDRTFPTKAMNPSNHERRKRRVQTCYMKHKVIASTKLQESTISLVELETSPPKWDCIPLYFVDNMAPVFGDHQYSSRIQFMMGNRVMVKPGGSLPGPQAFPDDVERVVRISAQNRQCIPTHIHCSRLTIPVRGTKRYKNIVSPLPDYFKATLKAFNLEIPETSPAENRKQ